MDKVKVMARAIELAKLGRYSTEPNPRVGCVIFKDEQIIGEGWHRFAGGVHAEIHALLATDGNAENSTVVVTLEPCSHSGKTPPCTDALIQAGVAKVIIAMQDPNPKVAGNGIKQLQSAGIEVEVGLLSQAAEAINAGYVHRHRHGRAMVRVKIATSLDGRTALANGTSKWITSQQSRNDVQYWRAQSGAIVTGAGTLLADKPNLNVRLPHDDAAEVSKTHLQHHDLSSQVIKRYGLAPEYLRRYDLKQYAESKRRQPLRVAVKGARDLDFDIPFFKLPGHIYVASANQIETDIPVNILHWPCAAINPNKFGTNNQVDLASLITNLSHLPVNEVWVEAGAKLAGAFIQAKLADELIVYQSPCLLGNHASPMVDITTPEKMDDRIDFEIIEVIQIDTDLRFRLKPRN